MYVLQALLFNFKMYCSKNVLFKLNSNSEKSPNCAKYVVAASSKLDLVFIVNAALWFSCS